MSSPPPSPPESPKESGPAKPVHAPGSGRFETSAQAEANMIQAVELRRAGVSFDEIAKRVGYSDRSAAYKAYRAALARVPARAVQEHRDEWNDRLERLLLPYWTNALAGDIAAGRMVIRIAQEAARINGFYAPTEVRVGPDSEGSAAYRAIMDTYLNDTSLAERVARWREEHEQHAEESLPETPSESVDPAPAEDAPPV